MRLGAAQRAKKLASSTMVACGLILPAIAEPFVAIIAKIRNIDADRVSVAIAVFRAKCWLQVDTLRMAVGSRAKRNAFRIAMIILPLAIFGSLWLAGRFDSFIDPYFDKSRLSTLIVTVGGGLVGATAVAFSIVVFSVQINVERTSVVMFQSLSRDRQLILVFVLAVFASVACASLSLFTDAGHIGQVLVGATWAALSVPCLIVFAYFRALKLINPHHQLLVLFKYTNLHLKRWSKRADRLTPWVKQTLNAPPQDDPKNKFDYAREVFFHNHRGWITMPGRSISQAMNYAKMYSASGDSPVVGAALYTVSTINRAYIATKGRTFFSQHALVNDNRASDGIITHTLEAYRRSIRGAVKRGDETEISQLMSGLGVLIVAYSEIPYPRPTDSSWHATLATAYLTQEATEMLRHVSADVAMQNAGYIANLSELFRRAPDLSVQQSLASALVGIAQFGLTNAKCAPATVKAMEQLTKISIQLFTGGRGAGDAISEITVSVFQFAEFVFLTPDTGLTTPHAQYLSLYLGGGIVLDMQTFDSQLVALINAALEVESDNENAKRVIENLSEWCKELPQRVRRLLLVATTARSRYSATVVWWIINVSTALYAISTAEGCSSFDGDRLKGRASWMMSAINFVPHDQPSVEVMRSVGIPEQLLRMSDELRKFDLLSEAIELGKISEGWLLGTIPHTDVWDFAEACSDWPHCMLIRSAQRRQPSS